MRMGRNPNRECVPTSMSTSAVSGVTVVSFCQLVAGSETPTELADVMRDAANVPVNKSIYLVKFGVPVGGSRIQPCMK